VPSSRDLSGEPEPRTTGVVLCERCATPCKVNPDRNEAARLLRRSLSTGVCANCGITEFLKTMEPLATVIKAKGLDVLLIPAVQAQAAAVLAAGQADAAPEEIDWRVVVEQWDLR
jgi:hypothetical protein